MHKTPQDVKACDKPKKDDPPVKGTPKGDKGKADKGKSKGKA